MDKLITDLQQARAIIKEVGEPHQHLVVDMLRSLTYIPRSHENEKKAQAVISHMEKEYSLDVANVLWADKFDEIPEHIKNW
ncbi:hypothetical protein [Tissierella sp. Yu-01]|uniref:hypothetical protein n=1 Tax=Tissierella sp. Yu-01 TaxID=3035694 RepID=UPI00240E9379|nr:hypothetical protein [Tissierella sp. Yu-01]WFA10356.1 hypothetical protein P3962_07330 [Tissierella sp. Yu-01]